MAIEAKVSMVNLLEEKLADVLTAKNLQSVLAVLSEVLDEFRVEQIRIRETDDDDLLECYLAALRVEGRAPKTVDRYAYILGRLAAYAKVSWRRMTVYHMRAYLAMEQERGIKDSTMEGEREVFTAFFNWLFREGLIEKNPVVNLGRIKCEKIQREAYSSTDIDDLKRLCPNDRDLALITFLAATGCRISEALGLNRDSVDFSRRECIVKGKGKKERKVYLDSVAAQMLEEYLWRRHDSENALFISLRTGARLTANGARMALRRCGEEAGVYNVHPHRFRRTLATELCRQGMGIAEVSRILGHCKIDTTMKYISLDDEDIRSTYNKYRK